MSTLAEALAPRSDQLNADDLIPGPRVLKITGARISKEERQTKIVINFEGDQGKPWKPCKTMGRAMVMAWAITDEKELIGKSVRVYRDPEVKFGDQGAIGGIRISHMSDIEKPAIMKLTVSQGKKATFTFHPLVIEATKPDKAADGVAALIANLKACGPGKKAETILTSAEVVKQREWLARQRPELAAQVDAAVAALEAADDNPFAQPSDLADGSAEEGAGPTNEEPIAEAAPQQGGSLVDRMAAVAERSKPAVDKGHEPEGPADSQRGEYDAQREITDRLIADKLAGAGRSGSEQKEYESLPDDMRAEVDEA